MNELCNRRVALFIPTLLIALTQENIDSRRAIRLRLRIEF